MIENLKHDSSIPDYDAIIDRADRELKLLYRSKNGQNAVYRGKYYSYLLVRRKMHGTIKYVAFCFYNRIDDGDTGNYIGNDEKLARYIEKGHRFCVPSLKGTNTPMAYATESNGESLYSVSLATALYHFEHPHADPSEKVILTHSFQQNINRKLPEMQVWGEIPVWGCFESDIIPYNDISPIMKNGSTVAVDPISHTAVIFMPSTKDNDVRVKAFTDYDAGLLNILRAYRGYYCDTNRTLWANKYTPDTPSSVIQLSHIVWTYAMGMIPADCIPEKGNPNNDLNWMREYISDTYDLQAYDELSIDHLTECKLNNCAYALAPMSKGTNAFFRDKRARIPLPWYFIMVNDYENKRIRVKCGNLDTGYAKYFAFGDLQDSDNDNAIRECFAEFLNICDALIPRGSDKDTLLRIWGQDSEKAFDPENPIYALTLEPIELFQAWKSGSFEDYPAQNNNNTREEVA